MSIQPLIGEEEFYGRQGEDSDREYLDGRLVQSPTSDLHEALFGFLLFLLQGFLGSCRPSTSACVRSWDR